MAYTITLTQDDIDVANFVSYRYGWSDWMSTNLTVGANNLSEAEAWEFSDAIESDAEGGHSLFPLLCHDSNLYRTLCKFINELV